jgi:hypothetical protein
MKREKYQKKDPLMKIVDFTLIDPYIISAEIDYRSSARRRKQKLRPFSAG